MTPRNADLPTRAEVLEHGPALLPYWLEMHVPERDPVDMVLLMNEQTGSNVRLSFKHQRLRSSQWLNASLTATDWQGMVREAVEILEGER